MTTFDHKMDDITANGAICDVVSDIVGSETILVNSFLENKPAGHVLLIVTGRFK